LTEEVKFYEGLDHPNIVKLISYGAGVNSMLPRQTEEKKANVMVTELCLYGDLFDISAKTGAFEEDFARFYFKQILSAI